MRNIKYKHFVDRRIFLKKYLDPNLFPLKNVTFAVSGGADSVYLLLSILDSGKENLVDKKTARIVHINHNWRKESGEDQLFVENLAKKLGIPCDVYQVYPDNSSKESKELLARNQRKEIFSKYEMIFTGHNSNDLYETVIWKTLQGRDPGVGIKVIHGNEVRPILNLSKEEIKKYLKDINQEWKEDYTNHDGKLLRSKMRKELIPHLENIFPVSFKTVVNSSLRKQL